MAYSYSSINYIKSTKDSMSLTLIQEETGYHLMPAIAMASRFSDNKTAKLVRNESGVIDVKLDGHFRKVCVLPVSFGGVYDSCRDIHGKIYY